MLDYDLVLALNVITIKYNTMRFAYKSYFSTLAY